MAVELDVEVLDLLRSRKGEWQCVASACDVSHSWISKFVNGHIPNPGFATLRRLRDQLRSMDRAQLSLCRASTAPATPERESAAHAAA